MTKELLIEAGQALYPTGWIGPLAVDLNVNNRTIRRWASGVHPVPPGIALEIVAFLQHRRGQMAAIENKVLAAMREK